MIVLVKTDLAIKIVNCPTIEELPVVVVEVGTIREPKIRVAFVYREYTNYISGLNSMESQEERLYRTLGALKVISQQDHGCVIMGDVNVDHLRLREPGYHLVNLARKVSDFQMEEEYIQMVENATREQLVGGVVKRSLLDVIYCNKVE